MSSDERLARLASLGRDDAFGALYERHQPALFAYCRTMLRDDDDARDALQSAALKALTAIARDEPPHSPRAWLFRIVHNEAITIMRRRRPHDELVEDGGSCGTVGGGPLDDVLARERLTELVTELHALPERQRRALLLRELGGLDYDEIASAIGMSAGAARQAVHEARRALAEQTEGREAACDDIRDALAEGDGRTRQRRAVRAHLRGCSGCRAFDKRLRRRTRDIRSLLPAGAGALFAQVLLVGGSAGGGGVAVPVGVAKGVATVLAIGASGAAVVEVASDGARSSRGSLSDAAAAVRDADRSRSPSSARSPGVAGAASVPLAGTSVFSDGGLPALRASSSSGRVLVERSARRDVAVSGALDDDEPGDRSFVDWDGWDGSRAPGRGRGPRGGPDGGFHDFDGSGPRPGGAAPVEGGRRGGGGGGSRHGSHPDARHTESFAAPAHYDGRRRHDGRTSERRRHEGPTGSSGSSGGSAPAQESTRSEPSTAPPTSPEPTQSSPSPEPTTSPPPAPTDSPAGDPTTTPLPEPDAPPTGDTTADPRAPTPAP